MTEHRAPAGIGGPAITRYEYDQFDRPIRLINPLGHDQRFEYHDSGQVERVIAGDREQQFSYNAAGDRLTA